jgi:UDPglucose 6-dehydrogenase
MKIAIAIAIAIAIVGLGHVSLSHAVLLAQHNEVMAIDIAPDKVSLLNRRQSQIEDAEIEDYLQSRQLSKSLTTANTAVTLPTSTTLLKASSA